MIIIKKFASKFKVELASELGDSMTNLFGLRRKILLIIKTNRRHFSCSFLSEIQQLASIIKTKEMTRA